MNKNEASQKANRAIKHGLRFLAIEWSEHQYSYVEGMITMAHITNVITTEQYDKFDDELHNIREERPVD